MVTLALSVLFALALVVLLRKPGVFYPALAAAADVEARWPGTPPGDDEEQLPETDRAPAMRWLPWGVAAVALLRVALFVTLHA